VGRAARLNVQANKKVAKKSTVVLVKDQPNLGSAGDVVTVSMGYFRNNLEPFGLAKKATGDVLASVAADAAPRLPPRTPSPPAPRPSPPRSRPSASSW